MTTQYSDINGSVNLLDKTMKALALIDPMQVLSGPDEDGNLDEDSLMEYQPEAMELLSRWSESEDKHYLVENVFDFWFGEDITKDIETNMIVQELTKIIDGSEALK